MKARPEKIKEYHIDSKQITAKKGKKNYDNTPNSLSTSHNHHKYEKMEKAQDIAQEKQPITVKQFQAVMRSLLTYCKKKRNISMDEHSKKNKLAWKLYQYLHMRYCVVGEGQEIQKIEAIFQQSMPLPQRSCSRCRQNGIKCKETHLKYLKEVLPEDIEALQQKLLELDVENELCTKILEMKEKADNKEAIIQELKFIIQNQEQTIKELDSKDPQPEPQPNYKRAKLEIFIDEDQT